MSRQKFDEIVASIRNEAVEEEVIRQAAGRVFRNIFDTELLPNRVDRIRGCADFQVLIPSYLAHTLPNARVLLLEDHGRQCVECRRMLRAAKDNSAEAGIVSVGQSTIGQATRRKTETGRRIPVLAWALAASLLIGTAIGVTGAFKGLLPGQHAVRATVLSVEGTLYRVSDVGSSLVAAGSVISNADELRTAKGARAILRLVGGGQVEVAERSDVSFSRGWRGTAMQVERGHVIVQALDPNQDTFYVAAGDVLIPVRNAVLSVNRGTKGSRIAVAKGSAEIEQPQKTSQLQAGQQAATDYRLVDVPIANEFAWSKNADYYLGLLTELSTLQKKIQAIPSPGLRYSPRLTKYVPANAIVYAAIPNLGGTLTEAKRIFDERLAESDVLRQWWHSQPASRNGELDRILTQVGSISQYLGDEIVLIAPSSGPQQYGSPLFLAEVRGNGLREYLTQNVPAAAGLRILGAAGTSPTREGSLFLSFVNNVVMASPDARALQSEAQASANPSSGRFEQTPFYKRIAKSYDAGVGYLLAIDMEQLVTKSVINAKEIPPGLNNAQYLVLERRDIAAQSETRASLSFSGSRQGIASWLGAPGPMGSLDFISPDANFAAAVVMKNPRTVVQELITYISQADANASQEVSSMQDQLGVNLTDDVAAPFGGDMTFAIDGTLFPVPAWKLAVEVYDFARLQQTISTLVDRFNQHSTGKAGKLQVSSETVDSRTVYSLRNGKYPEFAAYYTFVDGYLLAGPSQANLLQAIQNRQTGHTLVNSSAFQNQLPDDSFTNFSAVIYHNVGNSLAPLAGQLKASGSLSPQQQQMISTLAAGTTPGLICVYGEPDRIVAATKGSFLGFDLGALAGIEQGRPLVPLIASSVAAVTSGGEPQHRRHEVR